jgi:hypothetical protein
MGEGQLAARAKMVREVPLVFWDLAGLLAFGKSPAWSFLFWPAAALPVIFQRATNKKTGEGMGGLPVGFIAASLASIQVHPEGAPETQVAVALIQFQGSKQAKFIQKNTGGYNTSSLIL